MFCTDFSSQKVESVNIVDERVEVEVLKIGARRWGAACRLGSVPGL